MGLFSWLTALRSKMAETGPALQPAMKTDADLSRSTVTSGTASFTLHERITRGGAITISVFSPSQEPNARAQAKLFAHWARTPAGQGLEVILLRAKSSTEAEQFLLLKVGTRDAQWRYTRGREERERLSLRVLTKEEDDARSPVPCYENFPQPDCTLVPSGNVERIIARISRGEYASEGIALDQEQALSTVDTSAPMRSAAARHMDSEVPSDIAEMILRKDKRVVERIAQTLLQTERASGVIRVLTKDEANWPIVQDVIQHLVSSSDPRRLTSLLFMLRKVCWHQRPSIVAALTAMPGSHVDSDLRDMLDLQEDYAIWKADVAGILAAHGDGEAIAPIVRLLFDRKTDSETRKVATAALLKLNRLELAGCLVTALRNENSNGYALIEGAPLFEVSRSLDILPLLVAKLASDSDAWREGAALALGFLGDRQAIDPLKASLVDRSDRVRLFAAKSLKRLGR